MIKSLRRAATSSLIALGPQNPMVQFLIGRRCGSFGASVIWGDEYIRLRKDSREMRLNPKHFVYLPDMSERFDIYFSPLVPALIDDCQVLDFSRPGVLQTYRRSGLQFELASFPEEDEAIDSYFYWYRPMPGETIFDIGAHCGVSTYHFSKIVGPTGRVVSFEPDPINYSLLLRNIERHGLTNVTPLQITIAGTNGTAEFSCEETIGSGLVRHSSRASVGRVVTVATISLENAFRTYGPPEFCKIDIEGAEMEVISAAQEFLSSQPCQFALDTNHLVDGSYTDRKIEALFRACSYEAESTSSGMKTTWARPAR